jgi:predicted ribosomally synthesized peptide with SipW-like signal peptide
MILVIALAVLGVGYALWSETLTITGTVNTGEVDVGFSTHPKEECVDVWGVGDCIPESEYPEKVDAANCDLEWTTEDTSDGYDHLSVTVTGMYPSWHCKVRFDVTNLGNVPVHVKLPVATTDIPDWVAVDFADCYDDSIQLHQGETTGVCTIDIHFTNEQAPPENSEPYTFGWEIYALQWNEDPPPDIITETSSVLNFSSTGWGGWSCPTPDHPYVVSATNNCTQPVTQYLWQPGASAGGVNYPNTPFGYTYTPPEEGSIVQNGGGTGQSCQIILQCSDTP